MLVHIATEKLSDKSPRPAWLPYNNIYLIIISMWSTNNITGSTRWLSLNGGPEPDAFLHMDVNLCIGLGVTKMSMFCVIADEWLY